MALEGTDIRTLQLEPTANNIKINCNYISYYLPANTDVLFLKDIFGGDYPLPRPKDMGMPTSEGAVWRDEKLYYLSRPGGLIEEPERIVFYEYSTANHTAGEHLLKFPDSFSPKCFYVTWEGEVYFVGETATYKYTLTKKSLEKVVEFASDGEIPSWASSWHPEKPLLFYSEGNKLLCFDPLSGKSTLLYQADGEISEFFWGGSDLPTLLIGNRVEILAEDGKFLNSHTISPGAYSLSWVPLSNMVSYLTPAARDALPQLVIEDFEKGLRYSYRGCNSYVWNWQDKIWTYSEDPENGAALVLSHIHWEPGKDTEVKIPYFKSREEDPKLPLTYAQGDYEKIAAELFRLRMEEYKRQGSIAQYEISHVIFDSEEYWGFQVMVDYSVQAIDESWQSGNGELGKDGWIYDKCNFICIYRDEDYYVMGSQWSTSP